MTSERVIGHHLDETTQIATDTADASTALVNMAMHHASFVLNNEESASTWHRRSSDGPAGETWRLRRIWRLYVEEWVNTLGGCRPDLDDAEARTAVHGALALLQSPLHYRSGLSNGQVTGLLTSMALGGLALGATGDDRSGTPPRTAKLVSLRLTTQESEEG